MAQASSLRSHGRGVAAPTCCVMTTSAAARDRDSSGMAGAYLATMIELLAGSRDGQHGACIRVDQDDGVALRDNHKIGVNNLAARDEGECLGPGAVRLNRVRASERELFDRAVDAIGLRPGQPPLPVVERTPE